MNVIELSAYRLYRTMKQVDRNMTLFLEQRLQETAWDAQMQAIYRDVCRAEDRSIALLSEAKHD